jgi:hypothetical protein
MGRWAETYFTSPPERREQAVLELLHELEAENSVRNEDGFGLAPSSEPEPTTITPNFRSERASEMVAPAVTRCRTCGRELPASQKYCGMCGARQAQGPSAIVDVDSARRSLVEPPRNQQIDDWPRRQSSFVTHEPEYAPLEPEIYEPASNNELSLFQSGRGGDYRSDDDDEIFSYPTASRPYRVYVGIALAILIFALGYMAWRSAQATSETSHLAPPAPPVAVQTSPAAAPATTPKTDPADAAPNQQAAIPPHQAPVSTSQQATAKKTPATPEPAPAAATAERKSQVEHSAGNAANGAEELAMAERYLSGTNGQQRNSAQAANWLWKSMAKHNASATVLLSDLYLKGDGVSKNCDQARVLIDSAARNGVKEAGERLRHLQAFGCN